MTNSRVTQIDVPPLPFTHVAAHGNAALLLGPRGVLRVPFGPGPALQTVAIHEPPTVRTHYWHGFGGDFAFSRKAWILERTGLFWHASFRRELAGRYAIMVCSRYCEALADEMERTFGDQARAKLYREKAAWWRRRGLDEFRLSNVDRILARLKGNNKERRKRGRVRVPMSGALWDRGARRAPQEETTILGRVRVGSGNTANHH